MGNRAEKILDEHLKKLLNKGDNSFATIEEIKEQVEYQVTVDAMEEYGRELLILFTKNLNTYTMVNVAYRNKAMDETLKE